MTTPEKRCRLCNGVFAATTEFFHPRKDSIDGLRNDCRACVCERSRRHKLGKRYEAYQKFKQERMARMAQGEKFCKQCQSFYPATTEFFYPCPERIDSLHCYCKACVRRLKKNMTEDQREKRRQYTRHRRQDPVIRQRLQAQALKHSKAAFARRQARKRNLPSAFTSKDWQRCLSYWNHRCAVCDRSVGLWHTLAADHWIPLEQGGPTVPSNMIPLCHPKNNVSGGIDCCNTLKSKTMPDVWLTRHFGEKKAREIVARIQAYFDWLKQHPL